MKKPSRKFPLTAMLLMAILISCSTSTQNTTSWDEPFEWTVSGADQEGIGPATLDSIHQEISAGGYGLVDHFLVIRNGKLIFDKHYTNNYDSIARLYDTTNFQYNYDHPGWHPYYKGSDLHSLQSCTKSITSLLVGIAIDEGLIEGTDIKAMELFDGYDPTLADPLKDLITLQDLLTMRGGFRWDEWTADYSDPQNSCYILEHSDNWMEYILSLPMDTVPGTKFVYNGGITVLLGEIIRIKTGMRIDQWAEEKLFNPLDITDFYWKISPNGEVDTEGGLYLSIYDFAKIGQLILNRGTWQGERIVSEKWVEESTHKLVELGENGDWYGYQWWIWRPNRDEFEIISALGFGGQYLFIDAQNSLLTVMNRWHIHGRSEKSPFAIPAEIANAIKE